MGINIEFKAKTPNNDSKKQSKGIFKWILSHKKIVIFILIIVLFYLYPEKFTDFIFSTIVKLQQMVMRG